MRSSVVKSVFWLSWWIAFFFTRKIPPVQRLRSGVAPILGYC